MAHTRIKPTTSALLALSNHITDIQQRIHHWVKLTLLWHMNRTTKFVVNTGEKPVSAELETGHWGARKSVFECFFPNSTDMHTAWACWHCSASPAPSANSTGHTEQSLAASLAPSHKGKTARPSHLSDSFIVQFQSCILGLFSLCVETSKSY